MQVIIIDYGLGNVGSLLNMFKKLNISAKLSRSEIEIQNASHLVLPGVGSFSTGMKSLYESNLIDLLQRVVHEKGIPILGVCLGAQLMLQKSEEGEENGLGWVDGNVIRFRNGFGIKVPHMGWNNVENLRESILFANMHSYPPRFYFLHSYYFQLVNPNDIISSSHYGHSFPSAFRKNNIIGVQFHPEKSHKFGMQLLKNFVTY